MLRRFVLVALAGSALVFSSFACSSDPDPAPLLPGSSSSGSSGKNSSSGTSGSSGSSGSSGASGTSGASGGTSGTSLSGTFCHKQAVAQCAYSDRCLPKFIESTTCVAAYEASCEHDRKYPGAADAVIPDSCLSKVADIDCIAALSGSEIGAECLAKGTLENGAACVHSEQCKTGNCYAKVNGTCGSCADLVNEGASCSNAKCAPGLICLFSTNVCAKRKAEGDTCTGPGDCTYPLRCVGGSCKAPLENGSTCTAAVVGEDDPCKHKCESGICSESSSGEFVGVGESCDATGTLCSINSKCRGSEGNKKCVAGAVAAGSACSTDATSATPDCSGELDCDATNKCVETALTTCP